MEEDEMEQARKKHCEERRSVLGRFKYYRTSIDSASYTIYIFRLNSWA
jgi:hypothetical protein